MKKGLSILLMCALMIGSLGIGVFADSETGSEPTPAVSSLNAYSGYKSVALEWAPVQGATSYNVYRNGTLVGRNVTSKAYDNANMMSYIDKTGDESAKEYSYYVKAVGPAGEGAASPTVKKASATPLFITVTFNRTRTLKSHDKAKKKHTFKKGTKVDTYSFRFGKYIFMYKGHRYFVNYTSLKNHKARLNRNLRYAKKEAEYFANTSGKGSSTKYMIWANLYTQRLYVLTGSKGKWRMAENLAYKGTKACTWYISSGKPTMPTPTGMNLKIYKKKKTQRGVKWLSFYHSQTSLHGKVGNQGFSQLRSGGCIRNPDKYARIIYKKIPVKTKVLVY